MNIEFMHFIKPKILKNLIVKKKKGIEKNLPLSHVLCSSEEGRN